ncbi:TolC family outer membrane protein [uncultured Pseudodesulfovibrio sp.]|uniref:TolC family outer membrane protein n=1 Tax=uncultured Pseudodesulfovibrio sp. TaxID=2035858 RepID=UPI0029C96E6F|nr:TolC family outer membrane protein [uncultured Pseudodesulfovibrio sp.]
MIKAFFISILTILLSTTLALAEVDGTTSIKESVAGAVRQHPQIKSLLYNRDAMARNLSAALGRFFPSLDLTSNYGFQEYSSSTTRGEGTDDRTRTASDTTLKVTQNVFDGMSRYNTYEGSKARLSSAEYRLFNNVETIGLDAIRAHIDVVRQRRLVNLAEENIVAHQEVLESIAERVAGGAGSKADEMQARGRVARAETTLVTYTGGLHTAEASYIRLVGKMPGALSDPFFHTEYIPADMNQIMETSLKENPRIKVYQAEVLSAEKNKNVTNAAMFPTVDLEVSSRHTDNLDGAKTYLRDDRAMLAMSWNLFSGGSDYSSLQASDSRVREAESNLQDATDELSREVAVAWTEYQTAVGQIEKHQEALQYSMESRDMYLMQFNVGQRSLLDVLDSINEVFSNSVLLETAQSNLYFTQYKFLALNGELIKTLEIESKTYDSKMK